MQISKDTARCTLKNGSVIESSSLESCRGRRVKMVIVDEALDVNQDDLESIIAPTRNAKRDISYTYGFQDFKSKTVTITSACEKTNPFYNKFLGTVRNMAKGDKGSFACVLDYNAAVANGITDYDFFMKEKERMPEAVFDMEYGSKFLGANGNSAFPYELTQLCRTLKKVETEQPKNSKSRYFISLDIATSDAKDADNSIISVLKTNELADGSMPRKLVYMRSFHGKTLDILAEEVRKLCHISFPGTEKIIYDARGLGDSLDRFFDQPWVDTTTGKEYPPLVPDDMPNAPGNALKILHPFRAVQTLNQRLYTNMRVALEKRNIELPVNSRIIHAAEHEKEDKDNKDSDPDKALPITYTMQQKAIFAEADALQLEMSNIVAKVGASGNVLYDTPRNSLHKDRYSSLAMGNDYISELEKGSLKKHTRGKACVGIATNF